MEQLIQQLKVILGTNFALYLKSHNYHWNIEGSNFPQYHDFLNGFYTEVFAQTDLIAEHIRYLDSYTPGSMERFLELADIEEETNVPDAMSMLRTLKMDNDRYIIHLRAGIVAAENANEPAVSNFLQDILGAHQKKAWMLRSIIK
jgi:starvation-inducible DNA-binding protein|tara:strand:+ start:4438 stop:4872 length:435 start_codon:yes stop_codon:yes gene_type:complete